MSKPKYVQTLVIDLAAGQTYTEPKGAMAVAVNNYGTVDITINGGPVKAGQPANIVAPDGWRLLETEITLPAGAQASAIIMRPLKECEND